MLKIMYLYGSKCERGKGHERSLLTVAGGQPRSSVCASLRVRTPLWVPVFHTRGNTLSVLPVLFFWWPVCFCGWGLVWSFFFVIPLGA